MIGRELGRGAAGRVYVAEDAMLARPVAIKFIAQLDTGARRRFLLEARAVAKIHHPNVVEIYRIGTLDNRPYFVTELVHGVSLDKVDKRMPWPRALDIAIGVARGLAAAHRRNVVHCDLKPSNVMIDSDGVAKIIDFGLARIVADGERTAHAPVGTPDYMAPEVWCGEAPSRRADVYSFGAVLFELLAGSPPFADVEPVALRQRVTGDDAPALRDRAPEVDPDLAEVVARCLRREREARFADGDELREALERLHASRRHTVRMGENPYRGLLPFEASHRGVFFGRRSEIDAVVGRLRGEPIVLVTGDSGVGKSSLCRAGVVPAVVDGELGGAWRAIAFVPGQRPLTALGSALGDPGLGARLCETPASLARELRRHASEDGSGGGSAERGLLVFIDQLEELITLGDPAEVAALDVGLGTLLDGVPGVRLLATARADFLARISTLPNLGRDLSRLLYFLRPLPPERLRDVIVGPAAAVGARFESDAIVDDLIAATAQAGSGGLPLLSFALADLWEARDREDQVISSSAVTAMGGVAGALSRHADVVVKGMLADERNHARRILLRLVTAMGTRARRGASELALDESARTALDALVKGRLVVVHDDEPEAAYELAHECLLTGWTTLRQWLDADTAGRATRESLSTAAAEWVRLGRRSEGTWQGTRLAEAAALDAESLSALDREFVAASRRALRRQRRERWIAVASVLALIVLAFLTERYLAQRELTAAVDLELDMARVALGDARDVDHTQAALAKRAFTAFDTGHWRLGEQLWEIVLMLRGRGERGYRTVNKHAESAFAKDPTRTDVRALMGDIALDRALMAADSHDIRQREEAVERLELYDDDGSRRARWKANGRVVIRAPETATITLEPDRALSTGSADIRVPPGRHVFAIAMLGRVTARFPILVEPGSETPIDVALPPRTEDVPTNFAFIPAGAFLYGHADESDRLAFYETTPLHSRSTGAYLIGLDEVTFGEWLEYLDALPKHKRAALVPGVPSKVSGSLAVKPDGAGHWRLELQTEGERYAVSWRQKLIYPRRADHAEHDWLKLPVTGVAADDAAAYAAWLDRTGRVPGARLCSEVEWERAARGGDGRPYPGGDTLEDNDANLAVTHGSGQMGPDAVGSHPASQSPFGLFDMTGNAFELTISEQGGYLLRGGSYQQDRKVAGAMNRAAKMNPTGRDITVGFRLCATPPLPL